MSKALRLEEIVMLLVGDIEPRGESCGDKKRLENCAVLSGVLHDLIQILETNSRYKDSNEDSVKKIGKYCEDMLNSLATYSSEFNSMSATIQRLEARVLELETLLGKAMVLLDDWADATSPPEPPETLEDDIMKIARLRRKLLGDAQ